MKLMGMTCETNSSTAVHRVCKEPDMSLTNLFVLSGHLTYKDRVLRLLIDDSAGGIKKNYWKLQHHHSPATPQNSNKYLGSTRILLGLGLGYSVSPNQIATFQSQRKL